MKLLRKQRPEEEQQPRQMSHGDHGSRGWAGGSAVHRGPRESRECKLEGVFPGARTPRVRVNSRRAFPNSRSVRLGVRMRQEPSKRQRRH
jgi:hypothetical protein